MAKKTAKSTAKAAKTNSGPKSAKIVSLLQRQNGASIPEIMKATGWQAHSVRGFISGTLKRKQGFVVNSAVEEGKDRRYVIVGAPCWGWGQLIEPLRRFLGWSRASWRWGRANWRWLGGNTVGANRQPACRDRLWPACWPIGCRRQLMVTFHQLFSVSLSG